MPSSRMAGAAPSCGASRSSRNLARSGSASLATVRPAAMACPPPFTSRPAWRAAITAAPRSTPFTERPDPLPSAAVHADDEGRPPVAFDQAARDDADHADMPALALHHERRRQPRAVRAVEALDAGDRLVEHLALDGAALGVEVVQPERQRADLLRIVAGSAAARRDRPVRRGHRH